MDFVKKRFEDLPSRATPVMAADLNHMGDGIEYSVQGVDRLTDSVALKANAADVYSRAEVDAAVSPKADTSAVYTKAETFSRAETGTQITNAITASRPPLYGTGFPTGKVAAPVGTLYADEAATNGASLWQKMAGTGTTGWDIVRADTGWRNVLNDPSLDGLIKPAGIEATRAFVKRSFKDVTWVLEYKKVGEGSIDTSALTGGRLPAGFGIGTPATWIGSTSALDFTRVYVPFSSGFIYQGPSITRAASLTISYSTADGWPGTIPGTN